VSCIVVDSVSTQQARSEALALPTDLRWGGERIFDQGSQSVTSSSGQPCGVQPYDIGLHAASAARAIDNLTLSSVRPDAMYAPRVIPSIPNILAVFRTTSRPTGSHWSLQCKVRRSLTPATASTLRASADGAPVTSGSRLPDMAPCLVVEETDPLQIFNVTAGSRGNLPLARKTPAKYFLPLLSGMVAKFSNY